VLIVENVQYLSKKTLSLMLIYALVLKKTFSATIACTLYSIFSENSPQFKNKDIKQRY